MKKIYLVLLLLVSLNIAFGQQQVQQKSSHYKAAVEMLESTGLPKFLDESMSQIWEMQIKANPTLQSKREVMLGFFKKYMSWEVLKEDYIKVYMDEFTENELKDMTAFYRTPTGKKLAEKQMTMVMKGTQLGQQRVQAHMQELTDLITNSN